MRRRNTGNASRNHSLMHCPYSACAFTATERYSLANHEERCHHDGDVLIIPTTTSSVPPPSSSTPQLSPSSLAHPLPLSALPPSTNHQAQCKSPGESQPPPCNDRLLRCDPLRPSFHDNHSEAGGERGKSASILQEVNCFDANDNFRESAITFTSNGKYYLARSADLYHTDIDETNIWSLEWTHVPDEHLFPLSSPSITIAPSPGSRHKFHTKIPSFLHYDPSEPNKLSNVLLTEAFLMEKIPPHPNIATYFGCVVGENRIRGICLESCMETLYQRTWMRNERVNMKKVVSSVKSAASHLHANGLCHNDISIHNIMFREDGSVVLIDFDSCIDTGRPLLSKAGTLGFFDFTATHSSPDNDFFSIQRVEHYISTGYNSGTRMGDVQTYAENTFDKGTQFEDSSTLN